MRAVFLDYATVSNGDLDPSVLARAAGSLEVFAMTSGSEISERISAADIVLLNTTIALSSAHLHAARALKLVALAATGTDNVDLQAAQELGIAVCNLQGYCTASVAQHAWAMILSLTQHLTDHARFATDGSWQRGEEPDVLARPLRELAGRTLGVVGFGALGRAVAKVGEAFGMRVIVALRPGAAPTDPSRPPDPPRVVLAQLLTASDVVSLHCPLTPATRGMIGAHELSLMRSDALLINTARGALVDAQALAEALQAGRLGGAGIDVLSQEPPVDGNPLLDPGIPNLIVTPHIAWAAREARQRCLDEMAANIQDFLRGGRRGRVV
jgi:glycerate dehydrogenase